MVESADFDDATATATAIGATNLTGTGLAKESGGNLDTHTKLLNGTQAGALIANTGLTVGQEVAALIASGSATGAAGGAPLLHGVRLVYQNTSISVPASGTFNTGNITFTRPGYVIRMTVQMSGVNGSMPSIRTDLTWRVNATGGAFTAEEVWYVAGGGSSTRRTNGRGPTKGDTLQIGLTNGDAGNSATIQIQIWETTQHIARDDWRGDTAMSGNGGAAAANDMPANIVAQEIVSINAGATAIRNLPLYAGQVNIWINQNTAAGSNIQIFPAGDFNTGPALALANLDWTQAPHGLFGVTLPRCWCQVQALNNGGLVVSLMYSIIALEYAS